MTVGHPADRPETTSCRHISDIAQFFREIVGCCAVQSLVDEDCQFELDELSENWPELL